MTRGISTTITIVAAALIGAGIFYMRTNSAKGQRTRLIDAYVKLCPPRVDGNQKNEIYNLFDGFFKRADEGRVADEDVDKIMKELHKYVDRGTELSLKELDYTMAQVGYLTYRSEPGMNLEGGVVDHPVLNPDAALITLQPDSIDWDDFRKWKEEYGDSIREVEGW